MTSKEFVYDWHGFNQKIFLAINNMFTSEEIHRFFSFISSFFNIHMFGIYYCFAVIVCLYICIRRKIFHGEYFEIYNYFVKIGTCYAIIGFAYAIMKFTFNFPRPFCLEEAGTFFTYASTHTARCLSSFPSAHTAIVTLCVYTLWPFIAKYLQAFLVFMMLLIMLSRIVLAMHYPADIVYSLIIVSLLIWAGNFIFSLFKHNLVKLVGEFIYLRMKRVYKA